MSDLQQRVPGHSLIEKLMTEFEAGRIRVDEESQRVVIDDESLSWYRGVLGERHAGDILDRLGDDYTVLHSVPFKKRSADIDHVVIGPSGVVVINTKHSPGKAVWSAGYGLRVGASAQNGHIQNLRAALIEVERRLSDAVGMAVPVRGILCFIEPSRITRKAAAGGELDHPMEVLGDRELASAIHRRREISNEQQARITAAALRPDTWHDSPTASTKGDHIAQEFDALHAEIGPFVELRWREIAVERSAARKQVRRPARVTAQRAFVDPRLLPLSTAAGWLAAWPWVAALTFAVLGIPATLVPQWAPGLLTAQWAIVLLPPVLIAIGDTRFLRKSGVAIPAQLPWFVLLTPLVYLIARTVAARRLGRRTVGALVAHAINVVLATVAFVLLGVAVGVLLEVYARMLTP